ncbi:SRPBCC family protein [Actinocorallia sp. B10E7]|uniref:SRPBCC family protein n=1 Tax=Actinocorallia sp. B10E7 TaxID=3153558 RepID=UPI00325E1EB2
MSTIEQIIDVAVPVRVAYDQWTQFEDFPEFMEGVDRIEQVTPTRTHWKTSIAGVHREFEAEITEQRPDECIVWHTLGTPRQAGVVSFQPLDPVNTRVVLQMQFIPEGVVEQVGDRLNLVENRVKGDLRRFKEFIEDHGRPTGAWRGSVGTDPFPGSAAATPSRPVTDHDLTRPDHAPGLDPDPEPGDLPAQGVRPVPGAQQPAPGPYPARPHGTRPDQGQDPRLDPGPAL